MNTCSGFDSSLSMQIAKSSDFFLLKHIDLFPLVPSWLVLGPRKETAAT